MLKGGKKKMRLIDADKLENDIVENITVKAVSRMLAITQGQPTVKAIPIEWIKDYVGSGGVSDDIFQRNRRFVLNMIKDWEAENEANKC